MSTATPLGQMLCSPSGNLAEQKVVRILRLPDQDRNNFPEGVNQAGVGVRQVAPDAFMKLWKRVKWNHRKHVMFNVVIHVEVEKTKNRIQRHRA